MVDFTPTIQPTNDPTYSGLSQGTEKPQPNVGMGTLFQNIATIGDNTIKAGDRITKDAIKDKLRENVDRIQGQDFGTDQATALAASGIAPTNIKGDSSSMGNILDPGSAPTTGGSGAAKAKGAPAGVARLGENLADLTARYNAGKASNSYYLGTMNAMVKQVAAQYPGYKDEVIEMATSMLGVNPQNALRKSLLDDLDTNARARAGAGAKQEAFVLSKMDEFGKDGAGLYSAYKNGTVSFDKFVGLYAARKGVMNDIAMSRATIGLASETDAFQAKIGEKKLSGVLGAYVDNKMSTQFETSTGSMSAKDVMGRVLNQAKNPMTPTEMAQTQQVMSANIAQTKAELVHETNRIDPTQPGSMSLRQKVGDKAADAAVESALAPMHEVFDAVSNDKRGVQGYYAAINKSQTDYRTKQIIDADKTQVMANMQVVRNIGGDNAVNYTLSQANSSFPAVVTAMSGAMTYKLAAGQITSLGQEVKAVTAHPDLTPTEKQQLNFQQVENAVHLFVAPDTKPEMLKSVATALFSDENRGFVNLFDGNTQPKVFARLASPDMTKKVMETGDPEIIGNYQKWTTNSFKALYQKAVQDLKSQTTGNDRYRVTYNTDAGKYVTAINPDYKEYGAYNKSRGGNEVPMSIQGPVNRINSGLQTITPILKAQGQDPRPLLRDVLAVMGWKPQDPAKPRPQLGIMKPNYDNSYLNMPGE